MAEPDPGIERTVSNVNLKTLGDMSALAAGTMMQAVATGLQEFISSSGRRTAMFDHAVSVNLALSNASMGTHVKNMSELDPTEAVALSKGIEADLPSTIAELTAAIAAAQKMIDTLANPKPAAK